MNKPNLFRFATKELSQDAFICWLLAWANKDFEGDELHKVGVHFLESLLAKNHDSVSVTFFEIRQQFKKIDILVLINTTLDDVKKSKKPPQESLAIIIEDKVKSSQHGNQLEDYFKEIHNLGFDEKQILRIYFKTKDQAHYKKIEEVGYKPFIRKEFLKVLDSYKGNNHIISDFKSYWQTVHDETESFQNSHVDEWKSNAWIGFYLALAENFKLGNFSSSSFGKKSKPTYGGCIHLQKKDCILYVQLCEERLNFKIREIAPEQNKKVLRDKWINLLTDPTFGDFRVMAPHHPRLGKAMIVGYIDGYIMNRDGNPTENDVNVTKTVEYIKNIEKWMIELDVL
jgi:hypothetical protein